ncbi:MAG: hypothetical protein KUG81_09095 [Gammaproteobacteria bacterium]|nr:hypothetical protein [Gammaproteobacteria bacterium]
MGKYFKTSVPDFVQDKMFQLPAELMMHALEKTDKGIDESMEKIDAFGGLLDIDNLKSDNPQVNERLKGYRSEMDELTATINKSPLDYRKQRTKISSLSKKIDQDLQRGLLGNAQDNLTKYNDEVARVDKMTGVGNERKQLYKDAIKRKYEQAGSLNQQDDTYNDISEGFGNPLEEFDQEKYINTVATSFTPDKTSSAWSNPDGKGYIFSGSKTVTSRAEEEVEDYVNNSLKDGVWEAQQRQMYVLKNEAGVTDITESEINAKVAADKENLVNMAKSKLGFSQTERTANTKANSVWKWNQDAKAVEGGNIVYDTDGLSRDAEGYDKFDYQTADGKTVPLTADVRNKTNDAIRKAGFVDARALFDGVYTGTNSGKKISAFRKEFFAANPGISISEFTAAMNYELDVQNLESPNTGDAEDALGNSNYAKGVVKALNGTNASQPAERMVITFADGTQQDVTSDYGSPNALANDTDNNYIMLPVTSNAKKTVWQTTPEGQFIDSDGDIVVFGDDNTPVTSYEQALREGVVGDLSIKQEVTTSRDTDKRLMPVTLGNVKTYDETTIDNRNRVTSKKFHKVTQQFTRLNTITNEMETVTTDVYYDANKVGAKQ